MDNTFVCTNNNIRERVKSYLANNPNNYPDIGTWDVSQVTDISHLFYDHNFTSDIFISFNEDLNNWDVSNVTNMAHAFDGCRNYNKSLDRWNVANVLDMEYMFASCSELNQSFDDWNISNVVNVTAMFKRCSKFNSPLNNWGNKTSQIVYMSHLFDGCKAFDQPLFNWDVSNVNDMRSLFSGCSSFIQDLSMWVIFTDTNTWNMFNNCPITNKPTVRNLGSTSDYREQRQRAEEHAESIMRQLRRQMQQREAEQIAADLAEHRRQQEERQRRQEQLREEQLQRAVPQNVQPTRQQQLAQQAEIIQRVRENVVSEETSEFPECIICGEFLDNQSKTMVYKNCSNNCFDAIQICKNNHILHRGCILDWCNVSGVDVVSQMGLTHPGYIKEQGRKNKCPFCQEPLIMPCNDFKNAPSISIDELKEYNKLKSGGKKRKTRKHRRKQRKTRKQKRRKTRKSSKRRK